ncbi:hypothetical protein HELRODRAFT_183377 [Helobdella robusta]|uniref:Uncharacterized protein n=1 Tax=Helobdella robusta TaxID=6412 RepID=T1FJJ0_HELRO|nr:hypothetical protein HELRODRAFT_183377 [Helobdella robusta]ESO11274.1 hypothetical protein HELRODRAFT_183377 [Helobdella robusta]
MEGFHKLLTRNTTSLKASTRKLKCHPFNIEHLENLNNNSNNNSTNSCSNNNNSIDLMTNIISNNNLTGTAWKFTFQDFIPKKEEIESFDSLVDKANAWLIKNDGVKVLSCETLTHSFCDRFWPVNLEGTVSAKKISPLSVNYFIRALSSSSSRGPSSTVIIFSTETTAHHFIDIIIITGQILSAETISVPILDDVVDTQMTFWAEKSHLAQRYVIGLHTVVPSMIANVYESFEEMIDRTNEWMNKLSRRVHDNDLKLAAAAAGSGSGCGVISGGGGGGGDVNFLLLNMQSTLSQHEPGTALGTFCHTTVPPLSDGTRTDLLRILRVFYLLPVGILLKEIPKQAPLNFKSFVPQWRLSRKIAMSTSSSKKLKNGGKKMENMKELVVKANEYLISCPIPGIIEELVNIETVINPMIAFSSSSSSSSSQLPPPSSSTTSPRETGDDNDWIKAVDDVRGDDNDDKLKFLTSIRLYIITRKEKQPSKQNAPTLENQAAVEFGGSRLLTGSGKMASVENGDVHPGPIFLRNVVNRNYRYRCNNNENSFAGQKIHDGVEIVRDYEAYK